MGVFNKMKEKRAEKKEAKAEKKAQKQEAKAQKKANKQALKEAKKQAKIDKINAKTEVKLSRANKNNAKAEAIADGTYESPVQSFVNGAKDVVGSVFGGETETYDGMEYVPESVASGQTPFAPVGNPNANSHANQNQGQNKTLLYVLIGAVVLVFGFLAVRK